MIRSIKAIFIILLILPCLAHAVPITITTTGDVIHSDDPLGKAFGQGAGKNTILGATVTTKFFFDTNDIPTTNLSGISHTEVFDDRTNWLSSSIYVDIDTVDPLFKLGNIMPTLPHITDRLAHTNRSILTTSTRNSFFLRDTSLGTSATNTRGDLVSNELHLISDTVELVPSFDDILGNIKAYQSLDFSDPDSAYFATMYYRISDQNINARLRYRLSSLSVSIGATEVPEPSLYWALVLPLIWLGRMKLKAQSSN